MHCLVCVIDKTQSIPKTYFYIYFYWKNTVMETFAVAGLLLLSLKVRFAVDMVE